MTRNSKHSVFTERPSRRTLIGLVGLFAASASLAACSTPAPTATAPTQPTAKPADSGSSASKPAATTGAATAAPGKTGTLLNFRLSTFIGVQYPIVLMMQRNNLFQKYGLNPEIKMAANPDGMHNELRTGAVDLVHGGLHTVALMRTQGTNVVNVYSLLDLSSSDMLVRKGSPIQSYGDLKGKRLGLFGGPASTATNMLRAGLVKFYGFDPMKDSKVNFSAAPVVVGMIQKDEIDAAFINDPVAIQLLETGEFRSIGLIADDYRKQVGSRPLQTGISIQEAWGEKNPEAVTNYIRAIKESVERLRTNAEIWEEIAPQLGVKTPEGVKLLRDRMLDSVSLDWDEKVLTEQKQIGESVIQIVGQDFLPRWPDDAFTIRYNP